MTTIGIQHFLLKRMYSFLYERKQRVKIEVFSGGTTLNGGMPQGMLLRPRVFLVLINGLETFITSFKFFDDVTTTEVHASISNQGQVRTAVF
jgi:hypothetical protein